MATNKNQAYAEEYANQAMEQMRRYGIPASVILAQGILESSNGESELARNENNHFGIKATKKWLDSGGKFGIYSDDRPEEKFCSYDSVADSYEHHSRFLAENKRYAACFDLSADDYKGWAKGLERAGYATGGNYATSLVNIIERNGLERYDRQVMEEMRAQGRLPGEDRERLPALDSSHCSFPLERKEFLVVTVPFGKQKGIELQTDHEAVLATEDGGRIVAVTSDGKSPDGKSVTVEYARADGTACQVSYKNLASVQVKPGDAVKAGQAVGVSETNLRMEVVQVRTDGSKRSMDPAAYLADISRKGNLDLQLLHEGKDLLAKYKSTEEQVMDTGLSPEEWMKKLLSSEDSSARLGYGTDPVMEMAVTMFTSLMALALQIDSKEDRMLLATEAAQERRIDLSPLVPPLQECVLEVRDGGRPLLHLDDGKGGFSHELTAPEMNRLSLILTDKELSADDKRRQVASLISGIALYGQMSRNYEQNLEQKNGQAESLQMR